MRKSEVLACSFDQWYQAFKQHTIKSKVIPLEDSAFVAYLSGDGESTLRLPVEEKTKEHAGHVQAHAGSDSDDWSDDEEEQTPPSFPVIEAKIKAAITSLGGKVFPKLNWSAPRDAAWLSMDKTLGCSSIGDVLLLIKASDFCLRDLTQPFVHCQDMIEEEERMPTPCLIVREWREDLVPNSEFRCFINDSRMVGISQRHDDAHFPFISANSNQIQTDIEIFYRSHIHGRFSLPSFAMDIHRNSRGDIVLIDFGPWGPVTDPLMFTWPELEELGRTAASIGSTSPDFRFVTSDADMRPCRFAASAMPIDFAHLASGQDPEKLIDFLNLRRLQEEEEEEEET